MNSKHPQFNYTRLYFIIIALAIVAEAVATATGHEKLGWFFLPVFSVGIWVMNRAGRKSTAAEERLSLKFRSLGPKSLR